MASKKNLDEATDNAIAIISIGCRFPGGANSPESFYNLLQNGFDAVTEISQSRWDINHYYSPDANQAGKISTRYGAFLNTPIDEFDAEFFNISPREAKMMDPQQRLLLEVTWETLERAGVTLKKINQKKVGVFIGVFKNDYLRLMDKSASKKDINLLSSTGNAFSVTAGRLSYFLGVQGPAVAIDTASSSSLVAVHQACCSLLLGESEMAIAGGVNLLLAPESYIEFCDGKMLSPDGHCKSFDKSANGYVRGEGCGVVILKRLANARCDGDTVLAIINASGINNDGATIGLTVPNQQAQANLFRDVLKKSGYTADDIDYVEAHGSGTPVGDPIETAAIGAVYKRNQRQEPLLIGSVKTNIGHLEAAAGIAGLIKIVMALQQQQLPRNINFSELNPQINLQSIPAKILTENTEWKTNNKKPRTAAINSFAINGTNAHVIISEASNNSATQSATKVLPQYVVAMSAKNQSTLKKMMAKYEKFISENEVNFNDFAYTTLVGREHFNERVAIIAKDKNDFLNKLHSKHYATSEEKSSDQWLNNVITLTTDYMNGKDIDWENFASDFRGQKIVLPSYPFEHKAYWFHSKLQNNNLPFVMNSSHPLLGPLITSPLETLQFQKIIDLHDLPYLVDHKIYHRIVYPGAAFIEMILAAGKSLFTASPFVLNNLKIAKPLMLNDNQSHLVYIILEPVEGDGYNVSVLSKNNILPDASDQTQNAIWIKHVTGNLSRVAELNSDNRELKIINDGKNAAISRFYAQIANAGISYGPHFQPLQRIQFNDKKIQAEIFTEDSFSSYYSYPPLLDSAFQLLAADFHGYSSMENGELCLPVGFKNLYLYESLKAKMFIDVDILGVLPDHNDIICSNIYLYDENHNLLAKLEDYRAKVVPRSKLLQALERRRKPRNEEVSLYADPKQFLSRLMDCKKDERGETIRHYLRSFIHKVLNLKTSEMIPSQKGFTDLGMNSVMIVEFKEYLQDCLGANYEIPTTALFDFPSVEALAKYIERLLFPVEDKKQPADTQDNLFLQNATGEMLSDEEIAKLLRKEFDANQDLKGS